MKTLSPRFILAIVLLVAVVSFLSFKLGRHNHGHETVSSQAQGQAHAKKAVYTCPMHPSIVSDHPGKCPICHMDLQKVEAEDFTEEVGKEKKPLYYRHPMRGEITSPVPAKDEMGMDYVPVYSDETSNEKASAVPGRAAFSLSTERQQLIGVTTAKAESRALSYEVRASGRVAYDPDLFTAIEEYRQAVLSRSQMENGDTGLKRQSAELVESAKTKLRLMGLSEGQIRQLAKSDAPPMNLILPKGHVWIYAEVFEYEIGNLKVGQAVEVTAPSAPGRVFSGKLSSLSPVLNAQTKTVRVRILIPDPDRLFRPDAFVNVKIQISLGEKLAIPADAVLHNGDQDFVFVQKEKGRFEPRPVQVGAKAQDFYEIVSGLSPGETVVTAANFLIDSESRLRGAVQNAKAPSSDKKAKP